MSNQEQQEILGLCSGAVTIIITEDTDRKAWEFSVPLARSFCHWFRTVLVLIRMIILMSYTRTWSTIAVHIASSSMDANFPYNGIIDLHEWYHPVSGVSNESYEYSSARSAANIIQDFYRTLLWLIGDWLIRKVEFLYLQQKQAHCNSTIFSIQSRKITNRPNLNAHR